MSMTGRLQGKNVARVFNVSAAWFLRYNIEFSCRPESTRYATVRLTAFVLNRLHPSGQLQRFVMNTIRVMAWLERANLTAHATRATHSESPRCQTASRCASPTASLQFRRSHPMPSRMTAASATRSNHNPSDGVAGTRQPHRTCNKGDS